MMFPTIRQAFIYLLFTVVVVAAAACSEKSKPTTPKTEAANEVRSDSTRNRPSDGEDGKTLSGILDAWKTGKADTARYATVDVSRRVDERVASADPRPQAGIEEVSRPKTLPRVSRLKMPGGDRPGDLPGKRDGDQ